jgi:hypothetical protein
MFSSQKRGNDSLKANTTKKLTASSRPNKEAIFVELFFQGTQRRPPKVPMT